ncbi:MAG: hypothetical protein ACYDD2_14935 [Candidatus Acidiferrales bacterium]
MPGLYVNASNFIVLIYPGLWFGGVCTLLCVALSLISYAPLPVGPGFNENLLERDLTLDRLTNDLELSPSMLAPVVPDEGIDFSPDLHLLRPRNI